MRLAVSPWAAPPTPSATMASEAEPLALAHDRGGVGNAGEAEHELLPEGAEDEVVLVILADLAGMGHAVDVDLVLAGLAGGEGNCGEGGGGGHRGSGCVPWGDPINLAFGALAGHPSVTR